MNEKPDIVRSYQGLSYLRFWYRTVHQARTMVGMKGNFLKRLSIRHHGLFGNFKEPVFILGCPRSGTTFLGNVLAELPSATYYFEPPVMKYFTRLVYEGLASEKKAIRFYRRVARILMITAPGLGSRFIEKNPKHTWIAELLLKAFPKAKFIILSRDGRDVALSLSLKPWHLKESASLGKREPGGYLYGPYPHFYIEAERREEYEKTSDLHRCIWIWQRYAAEIERLRTALPQDCQHHLRYEDLVSDPKGSMEDILQFIGEDKVSAFDAVMKVAKTGHCSSVGRWRKHFSSSDLEIVEQEAGPLLSSLGYQTPAKV